MPRDELTAASGANAPSPVCRTCQSRRVRNVGRLPDTWRFAGKTQPRALPGGSLYRCADCGLAFRHPLLEPGTYDRLYRDGSTDLWDGEAVNRKDFGLVRQHIAALAPGQKVLDVGCYTGQLLTSLPHGTRLFGIEPNTAAAQRAASRGVQIVANDFERLAELDQSFDVITACDVIEHVPDPLQFLRIARSRLEPGGTVLLTTGNCDAWLWRTLGSSYWYCYFPEHISFIGERWLATMPPGVGLKRLHSVGFGNGFRPFSAAALRSFTGACLYACAPGAFRMLRGRVGGVQPGANPPPGSGATRDHIFCALASA